MLKQHWQQWPIPVRLVGAQAFLGAAMALGWGLSAGAAAGGAALAGAAIAVAGSGFFAARLFLRSRQDPGAMLRGFMTAEVMKLMLVIVLLVAAMHWFAAHALAVIATYAATSLVFLWALRWSEPSQTNNQGA